MLQNYAWEAFQQTDVGEGENCPLRVLLRWKLKDGNYVSSARVIMQGFKHRDVLSGELDKKSPTLSRLGRYIIFSILATNGWKFFSADASSAFLQADDIVDAEIVDDEPEV